MVDYSNPVSGSGGSNRPQSAFQEFTARIAGILTGIGQTLFPGDAALSRPEDFFPGRPAEPDAKKTPADGGTTASTVDEADGKEDLLRKLEKAVGDPGFDLELSDLENPEVVRLIKRGDYEEALDLIESNRDDDDDDDVAAVDAEAPEAPAAVPEDDADATPAEPAAAAAGPAAEPEAGPADDGDDD